MEKDYLLDKWLNQGLSEAEMEEFRQREDYDELVAILENAKRFKASHFSEVDEFKDFSGGGKSELPVKGSGSWIKPLMRIAAVLLMGIGVFYFLSRDDSTVIYSLAGEKKTITLPDASTVVLNALSEIRYEEDSWSKNRLIELEGEAYFDVVKGSSFKVSTSTGTVRVLGTEFNVKERPDYFEVRCFEGSVEVTSGNIKEVLEVGESLRLSGGQLEIGKHVHIQPVWTKNASSFERVPVSEVIAEMERQYNIEISLQNVEPGILFTGAFVHDHLENALKSVAEPLDLEYTIETNNQVSIFPSEH